MPFLFGLINIHAWGACFKKKRNYSIKGNMNTREDYVAFYKIVGGTV